MTPGPPGLRYGDWKGAGCRCPWPWLGGGLTPLALPKTARVPQSSSLQGTQLRCGLAPPSMKILTSDGAAMTTFSSGDELTASTSTPSHIRLEEICEHYSDQELDTIADFLQRTTAAGQAATYDLG